MKNVLKWFWDWLLKQELWVAVIVVIAILAVILALLGLIMPFRLVALGISGISAILAIFCAWLGIQFFGSDNSGHTSGFGDGLCGILCMVVAVCFGAISLAFLPFIFA